MHGELCDSIIESTMSHRLVSLLDETDGLVGRPGDDELALVTDRQSPDFGLMPGDALDLHELYIV